MKPIVLLPPGRCKGFGPVRQRKLNHLRWWMWLDCLRSMQVNMREDVLWEWFIMGWSAINVYDAYNAAMVKRFKHL